MASTSEDIEENRDENENTEKDPNEQESEEKDPNEQESAEKDPNEQENTEEGLNGGNHEEITPRTLETLPEEPSDLKNPDEVLVPTDLKAEIAANEILLTWGPPAGLSKHQVSYEVEWKKQSDSQWTKAITRDHKYLIKNLATETDYDMKVSAYEKIIDPQEPEDSEPEPEKEKKLFEHMTIFPENSTVSQVGSEVEAFTQRTKELAKIVAELERTLEYQKRLNKGEKIPKRLESKLNMEILKPVRRKDCPKRILFIITNDMFARSPQLKASARMQTEITRLFERDWKGEGDIVRRIRNGTRAQILNEFEKLRQRLDFDSHKMFICIILSYGNVEGFRTMDEEMIEYQEIFSMFNGSNWLHFSEKPKFFFIDVQPMKMERTGDYPQDLRVKELSEDEVEIRWKPPKMFQSSQLNYLVHCYRLNDQKVHTKTHELIAKKTSCVLDEMQKDVTYKISVWSIQATTQKKRGLPSQTKYTLREKVLAPVSERLTAKSTTYDTITIYWPLPLENRKPPYFAKYKEKTADSFKRTLLPPNETEVNQGHVLNFLKSNTEYIIRLFAGNSRILNEVKMKTLAKHQPKDLKAKHITPFEIELTWATPSVYLRGSYRYHVFYQMKNSTENSVVTLVEQHTLTDLIPDVVYTIWVTAEKDKFMGDPSDSIECHTPRCGPQNLQVDAHERSIRVYWDEAVVPAETESLSYRARLQNDNIRPIVGEVLPTPDAKYNYACYFRDLWTDTQYTLVITTVIDEGDWDPPTEVPIKTRRDPLVSDLEPHANNFLVAYSNTLGIEVGEKRLGGIFVPTLLELLRDYYETKNIVEIMDIVEDEVQIRSAVTGKIRKVISINTLLSRPMF